MRFKMVGKLSLFFLFFIVMLASHAEAAKVEGKLYSSDFELLKNVVVQINTNPSQTFVSQDGYYSFTMTSGRYNIIAYYKNKNNSILYNTIDVLLPSSGTYNVDIIINQPYIGDDVPKQLEERKLNLPIFILIFVVMAFIILIVLTVIFLAGKKANKKGILEKEGNKKPEELLPLDRNPEEPEKSDVDEVIDAIKEAGGRITQKDLRIKFSKYSEAKVSLIITELESKGRLEKIKKGRGNVIILKAV